MLASPILEHPFNPSPLLSKAVSNVIASLIYARRFEYEDPFFNRMLKTLKESLGEDTGFVGEVCGSGQWAWPLLCYKFYQSKYEFRVGGPGVMAKCREKGLGVDKPQISGGEEQTKVNGSRKGVSLQGNHTSLLYLKGRVFLFFTLSYRRACRLELGKKQVMGRDRF